MKSSELRIGNLFEDREGRLCDVDQVSKNPEDTQITAIHGGLTALPTKPIPLTEEWLLKFCGEYEVDDGINFIKHWWRFGEVSVKIEQWKKDMCYDESFSVYKDHNYIKDVSIIHEFQNLYFALTGEELTISESQD